jgi:hypothetical protein
MHFWAVWAEATMRTLSSVALVIFIASCAAQTVTPVAISQSTDNQLTCAQIDQEIKSNQLTAADLLKKNKKVQEENTAKVVASVVLSGWIALSVDLSHEEQIRMRALSDRNEELLRLKKQKKCP